LQRSCLRAPPRFVLSAAIFPASHSPEEIMIRFDLRSRNRGGGLLRSVVLVVLSYVAANGAAAQLAPNQTEAFGNGRLLTFTYLQNFDCVTEPLMDLDFNGIKAQSDPNEM
jgi:hypothetical protein